MGYWWKTGCTPFCDSVMKNNRPGMAGSDGLYTMSREAGEAGGYLYLGRGVSTCPAR